ncbi:hypothetical protein EXW72_04475 [Pseudomonas sp. BCA14]|uniref:hypothetical protein n=1 Tax=Pseudomonas TaxID=286 RepID=UPI000CD59A9A|nr:MULTISPECIES: hypothetical protein [Pseudomonas]RBH56715.1 hypothetical protein C3F00_015535 [Pseudomonas sp. MWU13-2860]TFF14439.1 hypothetical protein EXW70_08010 [Pseudomonas sp. JMN1]TFF14877.1 hypothetical protein EXW71_01030 [Pseudomonas sp. BCA17]TFF31283.1 hypothetical protein EXW72_04475 [Pseudomonas sp. BCA14]TFF32237.1 hypothetical protein EXW73_00280 [Pseudomonas sp. BCA13]
MSSMFDYDVSISPSPAEIDLTVAVDGVAISATITSVPSLTFKLTPTGNLVQKILSAVAYPIATLIASEVKDKPKDALQGKVEPIGSVPNYDTNGIRIAPSALTFGSVSIGNTPMLKIVAKLAITTPTPSSSI